MKNAAPHQEHGEKYFDARMLHVDYQGAVIASVMIAPLRRSHSYSPVALFERMAHESVLVIANFRSRAQHKDLRQLATILSEGLLKTFVEIYSTQAKSWNKDHRAGPFSAIRLPELAMLARRDPAVVTQYGAKNVESVFEQQLALILQSLGFIVIRTRRGERTVDLVCISSDPGCQMTILVEAKTTKDLYSLPTSDQRALLEYAKSVRTSLTTLPPLAFVLIIAPSAAKSVEGRLSALEANAGVPVRLMTAAHLSELRESIIGSIRVPSFRAAVLESHHRVLPAIAKAIADDALKITLAHENLVRAYLPLGNAQKPQTDHWDHENHGSSNLE